MIRTSWAAFAASILILCGVVGLPGEAAAQANFDCRRPGTETIAIICRDPAFSALDRQIDRAYRTAIDEATEPDRVRDNHTAWSRNVSACGSDRGCIGRSLDEQLAALEHAAATGRRDPAAAGTELPDPEPVYSPAPPAERRVEESSPDVAMDAIADSPAGAPTDDVQVPALEDVQFVERDELEADQAGELDVPAPASDNRPSNFSQMVGGGAVLGVIVAILAALLATKALADHSMRTYGWPMILNWWNVLHLVAGFAFWCGAAFGSVLGGAVVAGGIWLIVLSVNVRKTDALTGVGMTVVQPFVVGILFVVFQFARNKPKPYDYINRG